MSEATFPPGTVYTETTIHAAPEAFLQDAPYQIAIVEAEDGHRLTIRILGPKDGGEAVAIGDRVVYAESRNGIPFYRKTE
jgi:uncharacterized OB-fold protein